MSFSFAELNACSEQLTTTKDNLNKDLEHLNGVLHKLDELGEIMGEMLETQDAVEVWCLV